MFATCGDGLIKALVKLLKAQVLLRGDLAFKAFEQASTMYFIQNGCVQVRASATIAGPTERDRNLIVLARACLLVLACLCLLACACLLVLGGRSSTRRRPSST